MTSRVSKDELEDALFAAGIRNPAVIKRLVRLIDTYAYGKTLPPVIPDIPELTPGEWNLALRVTACRDCGVIKDWTPYFHVDKSHPSGHRITCKICSARSQSGTGGWMCPSCRQRLDPDKFGQDKRDNPRKPLPCLSCEKKKP